MADLTDEQHLRLDVMMALKKYGYRPIKTNDATARDTHYRRAADAILEQLRLSGWEFRLPRRLLGG